MVKLFNMFNKNESILLFLIIQTYFRKKVHKLSTPIPDACILQPDPSLLLQQDTPVLIARSTSIRHRAAGGAGTLLATLVTDPLHIKELCHVEKITEY